MNPLTWPGKLWRLWRPIATKTPSATQGCGKCRGCLWGEGWCANATGAAK